MAIIIFRKFNLKHIYFICYALCTFIHGVLSGFLYKGIYTISSNFYSMYITILSRFLSLIPYFINKSLTTSQKDKSKEKENNGDISDLEIDYIYSDKESEYSKNLIKSIFKMCIFESLAESLICIFYFINDKPEATQKYSLQTFLIINAITQYIISHFVLDYTFYKHHYLSLAINFFCILIVFTIDIIEIIDRRISDYQYYIYVFIRILRLIFYACMDNYAKHTLYTEFLTPFSLMVNIAIIESIFLLIFSIPFIFIRTSDTNEIIFVDFVQFLKGTNLLFSLCILLTNFFFETFVLIIIDRFSPSHLPLGFIIYSFCNNIYKIIRNSISNKEIGYFYYTNLVFYIILFIGAMIHNEIFIINKWGFNTNTKLFLDYKVNEELNDDGESDTSRQQTELEQYFFEIMDESD